MKKILVPTDFSETALKALVYAAEIALKSAGTVYLLHVITPDENRVWRPHVREDDYGKALTKERLTKLDSAWKSMLHTYPDVNIVTELANGPVTTAILDFAEQQQMDLVVMGTTGASGLKQLLMGSVAASTIGKTAVPVLTVPASYEMKEPRCLLFATNNFEEDKQLLQPLVKLATWFSAAVHVAVFVDTDDAQPEDYIHFGRKLDEYTVRLKKMYADVVITSELLEGSRFEETLEAAAARLEADLVVMVTYQKKFLERITGRSMTRRMAWHATIPLLALPAPRS